MDVLDDDPTVAAAVVQGCGVIQGFWFVTPGTADQATAGSSSAARAARSTTCGRCAGTSARCSTRRRSRWSSLTRMTADGDCRPMTLALINGDNTVVRQRMKKSGC